LRSEIGFSPCSPSNSTHRILRRSSKVPPPFRRVFHLQLISQFHRLGRRKARALVGADVRLELRASEQLSSLQGRLFTICKSRAPTRFPGSSTDTFPTHGSGDGRVLAEAVAAAFRAAVSPEVAARHKLDDLDELAEDIDRCLRKGAEEYVKSL
jgi:hypothetical protein